MTSALKRLRAGALVCAVFATLVARAPLAQASSVDVKGEVIHIADGDTLDVDIFGDGTSTPKRIRMSGIQAMEINDPGTTSDDDCHAKQAQDYLKYLLKAADTNGGAGSKVRLTAQSSSSASRGRPLRHVIRYSDGRDIGLQMIQQQYAFAFPLAIETKYNAAYMSAAAQAAAAPKSGRLWDNDSCGSGPYQSANLKMWVNYEAKGTDGYSYGEWVKIKNQGTSSVDIGGWQVRDSAQNIYKIPSGTSIAAGATLTIYVVDDTGHTNTATKLYWKPASYPIFENTNDAKTFGDGAYLIDTGPNRKGDIRAHFTYPCRWSCSDPLAGKVNLSANYDAEGADSTEPNGEWVNISNISAGDVDLAEDYALVIGHGSTHTAVYPFQSNAVIPAGERMRVYVGTGSSSALKRFWGYSSGLMSNTAGWARLRTMDDVLIKSRSWVCTSCTTGPTGLIISNVSGGSTDPDSETITITNGSTGTVNLRDYALWRSPYLYDFSADTPLAVGKTVTVYVGNVTSSTSNGNYVKSWGRSTQMLSSGGDKVALLTQYRTVRHCFDYGSATC